MKRLDLSDTKYKAEGGEDISETLQSVLLYAPASGQGFTIADVRGRMKVHDKFEVANVANAGFVDLEDAEYEILKRAFEQSRFKVASPFLIEIADRVDAAKAPDAA